jgi:hypothetical protein
MWYINNVGRGERKEKNIEIGKEKGHKRRRASRR